MGKWRINERKFVMENANQSALSHCLYLATGFGERILSSTAVLRHDKV